MMADTRSLAAVLDPLVARGADAPTIAEAAVAHWRHVDGALCPVLGPPLVAGLYARSLRLVARTYPWLERGPALDTTIPHEFLALEAAMRIQPPRTAAAGAIALFGQMANLLDALIGQPLTDRLLDAAPPASPHPASPQDPHE